MLVLRAAAAYTCLLVGRSGGDTAQTDWSAGASDKVSCPWGIGYPRALRQKQRNKWRGHQTCRIAITSNLTV